MAGQNWGRVDNFRYKCCFICVDASLPVLDQYVGQRVDSMIDAGLLDEVYDVYNLNSDYTRGLRQAIGVREFEDFLKVFLTEPHDKENGLLKGNVREILKSSNNNQLQILLEDAIERVKANTRRLVRRQVSLLFSDSYMLFKPNIVPNEMHLSFINCVWF